AGPARAVRARAPGGCPRPRGDSRRAAVPGLRGPAPGGLRGLEGGPVTPGCDRDAAAPEPALVGGSSRLREYAAQVIRAAPRSSAPLVAGGQSPVAAPGRSRLAAMTRSGAGQPPAGGRQFPVMPGNDAPAQPLDAPSGNGGPDPGHVLAYI